MPDTTHDPLKEPHSSDVVTELEMLLGSAFHDKSLLKRALIHRSLGAENSNETLEFLGDAVLGLVVSEYLYKRFPEKNEGELSILKALLVRQDALMEVARQVHLGDYIMLGKGEIKSGGRDKPSILAGAYEAIIGAIYADRGLRGARGFISRTLLRRVDQLIRRRNYKGLLQWLALKEVKELPHYRLVGETGPEHKRWFKVEVSIGGSAMGIGEGSSKKRAEVEAARHALDRMGFSMADDGVRM